MAWNHKVTIKHLFTPEDDHESVQASMNAIADVLSHAHFFSGFGYLDNFRNIPAGDSIITPLDYANRLLALMYDYADRNGIWID